MNKLLYPFAFAAGALVILWIGLGYIGAHYVALAMVALIGAVYVFGALELHRQRKLTQTLSGALASLATPPDELSNWLACLPDALRAPLRARIEQGQGALPGPALTPYLVGLLVMLGMLGTFLGMVVTFQGAVLALDGTSDLAAMRASLTAPIKGLGLAFGTSVAGVAASAMLGLMLAIVRRERGEALRELHVAMAGPLHRFSLAQRREDAFAALQSQAQLLPGVLAQLEKIMAGMAAQNSELGAELLRQQSRFQTESVAVHAGLSERVEQVLSAGISRSLEQSGAQMTQLVSDSLMGVAREATALQATVASAVQQQLHALTGELGAAAQASAHAQAAHLQSQAEAQAALLTQYAAEDATRLAAWAQVLESQGARQLATQQELDASARAREHAVLAQLDAIAARHNTAQQQLDAQIAQREQALVQQLDTQAARHAALHEHSLLQLQMGEKALAQQLEALKQQHATLQEQAVQHMQAREQALCAQLENTASTIATHAAEQTRQTVTEVAKLMDAASAAPRAAAEVIGELRAQVSQGLVRDNAQLEERNHLLATLTQLLDAINHAADQQRATIDALVGSSAELLERVGNQFVEKVGGEAARIDELATQLGSSAIEVASLGDAFGGAVSQFGEHNTQLVTSLRSIESALEKTLTRSDEQLAYVVAQAREVIDLSLGAQKQVLDELRTLQHGQASVRATEAL
jgi:hypothetical protein